MPTFMNNTKQNYTGKSASRQDTNTIINLDTGLVIDRSTGEILEDASRLPKILPEGRVLYNCQISTNTLRRPCHFEFHTVEYYEGGSAAKLVATNKNPDEGKEEAISLTSTSKRAAISKFTFKSRRLLLLRYAQLDRTKLMKPKMLTLTYPASYSNKFSVWKHHLDLFLSKCLIRLLPNVFVFWKLEPQQRGAPHFHLLIFSDCGQTQEQVYQLKSKWKEEWYSIVDSGDANHRKVGTWVGFNKDEKKRKTDFDSWQMVGGYIAKYLGKAHDGFKDQQGDQINYTGRFWGIYNRRLYNSFVAKRKANLTEEQFSEIKGYLVQETCQAMDKQAESHLFKMSADERAELKSITDAFDHEYQRMVLDVDKTVGTIKLEIPDSYHVKRYIQLHKQKRVYQSRSADDYGLFAFLEWEITSKLVDLVLN